MEPQTVKPEWRNALQKFQQHIDRQPNWLRVCSFLNADKTAVVNSEDR